MAKIERKTQKIFSRLNPSKLGVFGSAQALAPTTSDDPDVLQSAAYEQGWTNATISGDKRPPLEEFNAIKYINDYQNAYLFQEGIAEYDVGTEYYENAIVKETGTVKLYKSLTDNNVGNALSDIINWKLLSDLDTLEVINNLGSAAFEDVGSLNGEIPVIGVGDKLNNSILNISTNSVKGISQLASDTNVFNKNASNTLTGQSLFNSVFFHQWSSGNSDTGLAQLVPTGVFATVGYNLLSTFLESNESNASNVPLNFKDTTGTPQATILDEANNKFMFPSNLETFGTQYIGYSVRTILIVDFASTNNGTTKLYVRMRRVVDDSIIAVGAFSQSDFIAQTSVVLTASISTFVNSETDPFVVDGVYFDILNDVNSTGAVTLQDVSIRIFKN